VFYNFCDLSSFMKKTNSPRKRLLLGAFYAEDTPLTFCFGTSKCILGAFLLMDKANLQLGKRAKNLRPCMQVEKVLAKVDSFSDNRGTSDVRQRRKQRMLGPAQRG
jgi:hypothetical protein